MATPMDVDAPSSSQTGSSASTESKSYAGSKFHLSYSMTKHDDTVRAIAIIGNDVIAAGSYGGQMAIWQREDERKFFRTSAFAANKIHPLLLCCDAVPAQVPGYPANCLISGGTDGVAKVFTSEGAIVGELKGHAKSVNSVSFTADGDILTGSWDGTVKVWREGVCKHTINSPAGAAAAATEVLALPTGEVVTGSATTIIIYRGAVVVKTISEPHGKDSVRRLCAHPFGFASCGNDGCVRVFSNSGEPLIALEAHPGFLCNSICLLSSGELVTAAEDRTVKVWAQDGSLVQTIEYSGIVLSIRALPNGDIVLGGNDKCARIFTRDAKRIAPAAELAQFTDHAAQLAAPKPDALDMSKLPNESALLQSGTRDGERRIIKKNNKALVYLWSADRNDWELLGEAFGQAPKSGPDGRQWDVVESITVEGRGGQAASYPLCFNKNETPEEIAARFISDNKLPDYFVKDVVQYVSGMVDQQAIAARQQSNKRLAEEKSLFETPLWVTGPPLFANDLKAEPMKNALLKNNGELTAAGHPDALTDGEMGAFNLLMQNIAEQKNYHMAILTEPEKMIMVKMMRWPPKYALPVLDAFRVLMVHQDAVKKLGGDPQLQRALLAYATYAESTPVHMSLVMKAISNWVAKRIRSKEERADKPVVPADVLAYISEVLDTVASATSSENANVAHAYVMLAHNVAHWLGKLNVDAPDTVMVVYSGLFELLNRFDALRPETSFYALLTIASIAFASPVAKGYILDGFGSELKELINKAKQSSAAPLQRIASDLRKLFNSL